MSTRWTVATLALAATIATLQPARAQDAGTLRATHATLADKLANNPFRRPLVLESVQSSDDLRGEVYAVVDQPFSVVAPALQGMTNWCDLLILHLNVKNCRPPANRRVRC